ncbi:MAG: hypothetical protein CVT77_04845 [Alphaproteobacteria bacterium HGW-Alphaproteobacteria-16]|nr:MAG: hypothetical protein CVT77_04845 [Alphaproteobacteria bacterium HGW-Alphaproteobacteria-16]
MSDSRAPRQVIEIDVDRNLVIVTATGFFTLEAAHAATMETRRAVESLGAAAGQHLTLYDVTGLAPLTAETVDLIRMGFVNPVYRPIRARKIAFAASSPLLRRQIERVREARPDITLHPSREAALAWLLG